MKLTVKIGQIECIYEADTPKEVCNLYKEINNFHEEKNQKYKNGIKFTILQNGKLFKENITIEQFEKELKRSCIDNLKCNIQI
ncbi:hypothetical protein [Clostridium sporogenes]|uniref:hypothetical protein n=1 Tax=Clostridium sporogenes TaxID=1509 RepID=UPI0006656B9F|nr:hypothetical protein [Clostridium sporogenes]